MKKLMITGSYPPNDICGVGDYTACFMSATDCQEWNLYYSNKWGLSEFIKKIKAINSYNSKYIIMQYPTQGYGWSLLPQLLAIYYALFTRKKFITVLHEFSQRTFKAKLATIPFLLSNGVIFTNKFEKEFAIKIFPFRKRMYHIVKIFSNITSSKKINRYSDRYYDICYFGHIRPLKGLEDFVDIVLGLKERKILIVGQVLKEYEEYAKNIEKKCNRKNITILYNRSIDEVSNLLNNSKIAFLPFPDGVSERRGSLLASLSNGVAVFTYRGKYSTEGLLKTCYITNRGNVINDIFSFLENMNDEEYDIIQKKNKEYLTSEIPHSWVDVVKKYENIINAIK